MSSNWDGNLGGDQGALSAQAVSLQNGARAQQNWQQIQRAFEASQAPAKRVWGKAVMQAVDALGRLRLERERGGLRGLGHLVHDDNGAPGSDWSVVRAAIDRRFESRRAALVEALLDAAAEELWPEELARDVMET